MAHRYMTTPVANLILVNINNNNLVFNHISERKRLPFMKYGQDYDSIIILPTFDSEHKPILNLNNTFVSTKLVQPFKKEPNLLKKKISWSFLKFRYHGKGYKIRKVTKIGKLSLRFGKSHWTKILYTPTITTIRRTKKNSYCLVTTIQNSLVGWDQILKSCRGVNMYTKRGVRLHRTKFKRRFGKVSQASSVYK